MEAPRQGWIRTLREALGMSQADVAKRLGVIRQAVAQLEGRERDESATLGALRQAAEALDADLVYAIVPRRPPSEVLEERAQRIAHRMVTSVGHSMRLEDQETDADLDERIAATARKLLESPGRLWKLPDEERD